jgi:phosphatidylinositol glycan class W
VAYEILAVSYRVVLTNKYSFQHSLTYDGLKEYIIKGLDGKGGRLGLVDANREGIYSCIGYLSIYIMGVQLGKLLMKKRLDISELFVFHCFDSHKHYLLG